jgi:hypothetical protein
LGILSILSGTIKVPTTKVLKELRLEALSFLGHGDAAKMLQMGQEVDLESLEPQFLIYPETEKNRENLQNAAHRVHDKKMERCGKESRTLRHPQTQPVHIDRQKVRIRTSGQARELPDYMVFNNPLRILQAIDTLPTRA